MNSQTCNACSLANRYIFAEELRELQNNFVIENDSLIGKIRTPLNSVINYYYLL